MANVPNTSTFSLIDVVAVFQAGGNLQACFNAALDGFFDPAYKGSKNSLLNFRNYQSPWITPGVGSFTFDNTGYLREVSNISTNITASTLPSGFIVYGSPAWLSVDVWDNINNRVETGAYYNGDSVRAIPTGTFTGTDRLGNIYLGDVVNHELTRIGVTQLGSPAHAYFGDLDPGVTFASSSISINGLGSVQYSFSLNNFSGTSIPCYLTLMSGTTVVAQQEITARNTPYGQSGTIGSTQRGYNYYLHISKFGYVFPG